MGDSLEPLLKVFQALSHVEFCMGQMKNSSCLCGKVTISINPDSKPSNYTFANHTEKMTEAEVIAKFSSSMS